MIWFWFWFDQGGDDSRSDSSLIYVKKRDFVFMCLLFEVFKCCFWLLLVYHLCCLLLCKYHLHIFLCWSINVHFPELTQQWSQWPHSAYRFVFFFLQTCKGWIFISWLCMIMFKTMIFLCKQLKVESFIEISSILCKGVIFHWFFLTLLFHI